MRNIFKIFLVTIMVVGGVGCASGITEAKRTQAKLQYDLAVAEMGNGNFRSALRELLIAIDADPTLPQAHNALGLAYHTLGHGDESIKHYRKAVELKPDFSEAYHNMGIVLLALGRYDEAIVAFKKALSDILYSTPELPEAHLGWTYYKQGKVKLGLRHLKNALAAAPDFCLGYGWLARIGLEADRATETIAAARRFEKHCMDNKEIADKLAPEFVRELRYHHALGLLKSGLRDDARAVLTLCSEPVAQKATLAEEEIAAKCAASLAGL